MKALLNIFLLLLVPLTASGQAKPPTAQQEHKFQMRVRLHVTSDDNGIENQLQSALNREFKKLDGIILDDTNFQLEVNILVVPMRSVNGDAIASLASIVASEPLSADSVQRFIGKDKKMELKGNAKDYLAQFSAIRAHFALWGPPEDFDSLSQNIASEIDSRVIDQYRALSLGKTDQ